MKIVVRSLLGEREVEPLAGPFASPRRRNITITPNGGCLVRLPVRAAEPVAEPVLSAVGG